MKSAPILYFLMLVIIGFACSVEDDTNPVGIEVGELIFSTDTVSFDTLITSRTSITRRFRIFNPSKEDVILEEIAVAGGENSFYDIIVNGKQGTSVRDELLVEGDSLLVLVNVNIDPNNQDLPFLVKDSVIINWSQNATDIKLEAWGQNATFLRSAIICDETWTNERPYVIQGSVAVDSLCTLTIEPGARILVDNGASIFVQGSLDVQGDSGNVITFRNTRFDPSFLRAPGQWGGLIFFPGSRDNRLSYVTIENAVNGIFTFGTNITSLRVQMDIDHTTIRHMSGAGIQAFSSEIEMSNSQVYDCGGFIASHFVGGDYTYDHCTFTNEQTSFIRDEPSVVFLDNFPGSDEPLVADLSLSITNSIVWGSEDEELLIGNDGGGNLETQVQQNIIRSEGDIPDNFTSADFNFPGFISPFSFDYQLDSLAFARDKAVDSAIADDLLGIPRDAMPDIGAFERVDQE